MGIVYHTIYILDVTFRRDSYNNNITVKLDYALVHAPAIITTLFINPSVYNYKLI